MWEKKRWLRLFNIGFLGIFLCLLLFINFFHIEETLYSNDNCPACQFQNSVISTSPVQCFCLPDLSFIENISYLENNSYNDVFFVFPSSRSPPSA